MAFVGGMMGGGRSSRGTSCCNRRPVGRVRAEELEETGEAGGYFSAKDYEVLRGRMKELNEKEEEEKEVREEKKRIVDKIMNYKNAKLTFLSYTEPGKGDEKILKIRAGNKNVFLVFEQTKDAKVFAQMHKAKTGDMVYIVEAPIEVILKIVGRKKEVYLGVVPGGTVQCDDLNDENEIDKARRRLEDIFNL